MEIARLAVAPGVTVDSSPISDIALESNDTTFPISPGNPLVDDFNPYRYIRTYGDQALVPLKAERGKGSNCNTAVILLYLCRKCLTEC